MVKKAGERPKIVADTRKRRAADEAAIENAWKVSGDLHVIANRLGMCRLRNEPPPAWVHKALRALGVPGPGVLDVQQLDDDDPGYRWLDLPDKTSG